MPPKRNTALDKLKAEIKSKEKAEKAKKEKQSTILPTLINANRNMKEKKAIIIFLKKIGDIPDSELVDRIREFLSEKYAPSSRKFIFEKIINELPPDQIKSFINAFINQTRDNLSDFYNNYTTEEKIKNLLEQVKDKLKNVNITISDNKLASYINLMRVYGQSIRSSIGSNNYKKLDDSIKNEYRIITKAISTVLNKEIDENDDSDIEELKEPPLLEEEKPKLPFGNPKKREITPIQQIKILDIPIDELVDKIKNELNGINITLDEYDIINDIRNMITSGEINTNTIVNKIILNLILKDKKYSEYREYIPNILNEDDGKKKKSKKDEAKDEAKKQKLRDLINKDEEKYFTQKQKYLTITSMMLNILITGINTTNKKKIFPRYIEPNCVKRYTNPPWLGERVYKIYISGDYEDIKDYITDTNKLENGQIWYAVNKNFIILQCLARKKSQKDNIFTIELDDMKLEIQLAYETANNFIIQNEEVFNTEKEFLKKVYDSELEKMRKILNENIYDGIREIGINILHNVLVSVAPDVKDYKNERSEYILHAINHIYKHSKTVRDFAFKLGELVVYLKYLNKIKNFSSSFIERVKDQYYLPTVLVDLSIQEKLPEIDVLKNDLFESEVDVINYFDNKLESFVNYFSKLVYMQKNPTERRTQDLSESIDDEILKIKIEPWYNLCVNKEDIGIHNYQIKDLVYYREPDDKIYCLVINNLIPRFNEGNYINPYSNNVFSDSFITEFNRVYKDRNVNIEINEEQIVPSDINKDLTPGLLDLILKDLENEYQSSKPDTHSEIQDDSESDDSESDDSESDKSEYESEQDNGIKLNCYKCSNHINNDLQLKSFKKKEVVNFCSFRCFEDAKF
uniref:Uncharacterized protein n=1 Tax=viral metagenome TaxID=1070528 RepID=A0A6C0CYX2_9ZZZZ